MGTILTVGHVERHRQLQVQGNLVAAVVARSIDQCLGSLGIAPQVQPAVFAGRTVDAHHGILGLTLRHKHPRQGNRRLLVLGVEGKHLVQLLHRVSHHDGRQWLRLSHVGIATRLLNQRTKMIGHTRATVDQRDDAPHAGIDLLRVLISGKPQRHLRQRRLQSLGQGRMQPLGSLYTAQRTILSDDETHLGLLHLLSLPSLLRIAEVLRKKLVQALVQSVGKMRREVHRVIHLQGDVHFVALLCLSHKHATQKT